MTFEEVAIGVVATAICALIPYFLEVKKKRKFQHELEETRRKYIIRTSLMSLKAIFSGGDSRAPPTKGKLKHWKCQLDGYIGEYKDNVNIDLVKNLAKKIESAPELESEKYSDDYIFPDKGVKSRQEYQEIVTDIQNLLEMNSFAHGLDKNYQCK